jgi:hypothetical protein
MKRKAVLLVMLVLALLTGYWMGQRRGSVTYAENAKIKRSYGRCIGAYTSGTATNLIFANDEGRITFVSIFNGQEVGHFDPE